MKSIIEQDEMLRTKARSNVFARMKKRAPETITDKILVDLIVWYANKMDDPTNWPHTISLLLRGGWLRFKDFGFRRSDLRRFHSYGQLSDHMMQMLEEVPQKVRGVFYQHEERKYRIERSEYIKLQ